MFVTAVCFLFLLKLNSLVYFCFVSSKTKRYCFQFRGEPFYIVEVISNQSKAFTCQFKYSTAAKFPRKFGPSQQNLAFATFQLLPCTKMGNYD